MTPPPFVRNIDTYNRKPKPQMLRALEANSLMQVQRLLQLDEDSAVQPFWDHAAETPIRAAVRLQCRPEIIDLLLGYGA